jgi:ubiquinone/menaquinone biosynthesis C-methylase UbiE
MKDNFSKQADLYARYRPSYPPELFDFVLAQVRGRQAAWDCATGNGQTAKELAGSFNKVFATDVSQKQLDNAWQAPNIFYSLQPAEQTNFDDNTFDLVTVSQALHWFQFDKFYKEVRRVAKPGAFIAVWMYALLKVDPEIDKLISHHHLEILDKYWDKERKYVDEKYTGIPFTFEEIKCPLFKIEYEWSIKDLEGYLNTWSALQKFISANNYNPVEDLIKKIIPFWKTETKKIVFPVYMRMGRIDK